MRRAVLVLLIGSLAVGSLTSCWPVVEPSGNGEATASSAPATPGTTPPASPVPTPLPPDCTADWDTAPKVGATTTSGSIINVRAGRHDCFDRLVVDFDGRAGGFDVRYVPAVMQEGSGEELTLRGGAFIRVLVLAPSYDPATGESTYQLSDPRELVDVSGYTSFQQLAWGGSFEGRTVLGLGVKSELPFRVFTLPGPGDGARLVIDVAG